MPDLVSHWLLGNRLLNDAAITQKFPFLDQAAFLWGCQGPDILFYHRCMPWQKDSLLKYGSQIHGGDPTQVFRSLAKVCRYCRDREDFDLILSYALGFCCHYCYDRRVHPLVHYNIELLKKTDERGSNYRYHNLIESNYDIMLLRWDKGGKISDMKLTDCLPSCEGLEKAVALVYSLLLCDLYGIHPPRQSAMLLAEDFRNSIALRNDNHFIKKPVAEFLECLIPYVRPGTAGGVLSERFHAKSADSEFDYGNVTHNVWFDPRDTSVRSNLSFFDLTDMAQKESEELMELFIDDVIEKGGADFAAFTEGMNFSGSKNT